MTYHKQLPFELWHDKYRVEEAAETSDKKLRQSLNEKLFSQSVKYQVDKCVVPTPPPAGTAAVTNIKGELVKLWMSPSQQVINQLIYAPPLVKKKADVQTVASAGKPKEEFLMKRQMEDTIRQKEEEIAQRMKSVIELITRKIYLTGEKAQKIDYEKQKEKLKAELEVKKREAVDSLRKEFEVIKNKEFEIGLDAVKEEMRENIKKIEETLKSDLEFKLQWESNRLYNDQQRNLKCHMDRWIDYLEKAKESEMNRTGILVNAVKMESFKNMMAFVETEKEKRIVEDYKSNIKQETEMSEMTKLLQAKQRQVDELESEKEWLEESVESLENFAKELMVQFQKFINYILREQPGQAEYLLSLDQIINRKKSVSEKESELSVFLKQPRESISLLKEFVSESALLPTLTQEEIDTTPSVGTTRASVEKMAVQILRGIIAEATLPSGERIAANILRSIIRKATPPTESVTQVAGGILDILVKDSLPTPAVGTPVSSYPSMTTARLPLEMESAETVSSDKATSSGSDATGEKYKNRLDAETPPSIFGGEKRPRPRRSLGNVIEHLRLDRTVEVIGDSVPEDRGTMDEFTRRRVQSIEKIFDKHPSIMKLFVQK